MAEKCIVTIKEEQQHQQQCPSPLGEIKNDSVTALTGTPTTIITSSIPSATTAISLPSTTTVSASSTPTQSGTIDCDDDDQEENGGKPREKGCYAWFYSTNHGVVVGHSTGNQIHLETPALEEKSNGGMNLAKPKRLSDEFYSADDDYDEDDDDEMIGGGEDGGIGISSSSSGSSSLTGISKSVGGDGDCEAHASLNEIKNLSITNGGAELGEDRYEQDENSISDPIYISEETSSCSSGHQRIIAEEASVKAQETEEPSRQHPEQPLGMEQEEIPEDEGVAALEDNLEDDEDDEVDEDDPHDVQSIDAIERRDFEQEQKLTGGIIIKNSALIPDNHRLNLEVINSFSRNRNDALAKKSQSESGKVQLITTPTSSRHAYKNCCNNPSSSNSTSNREQNSNSTTKSTVKVNLSASLDSYCAASESVNGPDMADGPSCSSSMASSSSSSASSSSKTHNRQQQQQLDAIFNSNSNDSLSSDRSIFIPNLQALKASAKDCPTAPSSSGVNEPGTSSSSSSSPSPSSASCSAGPSTSGATKAPSDCSLSSCATSVIKQTGECSKNINHHPIPSTSTSSSSLFSFSCPFGSADRETGEGCSNGNVSLRRFPSNGSNFADNIADEVEPSSSSHRIRQPQLHHEHNHMEDPLLEPSELSMPPELAASASVVDHECDEDNWADCEEGSDEEICTCRDYTDDEGNGTTGAGGHASSEDELPSRDVDLSSFTHMDAAEDILAHDPSTGGSGSAANTSGNNAQTPRLHRKRKLTENRILFGSGGCRTSTGGMSETTGGLGSHCDSPSTESLNYNSRKRLALDSTSSPRTVRSPSNLASTPTTSSALGERKTPRSVIPTKDNPPPELNEWLLQFQRWTPVERLVAVDMLIERCEPTQVRHMMKVIEPQFQRDFISLLPKEVALQVLSYLDPKDLLRAAQTCRSWRFLADDNLLWKEKCKEANIVMDVTGGDRPKRGRAGNMPPISSPWKAAYMRQHIIEMNWRSRPIRTAKVLKGHDDHVITCLQFCGNRIVSGSDDNTLKVWSAITGKCLRTLVGHTGGVWSSQMSGNIIISGSTDRTLKVWNAETGQLLHTLYGHTSTVRCMHLHGNKVVSGSRDATLRVWDVDEGTCLHVLVGHLAAVRCVQYDGRLVVSGAYDYMVKVWNPERQECLHTLQGHTNRVYSLQFDGVHVVSGSLDTSIRVWEAETGSCKHALMGHQSLTSGMELRSNILVSGNADSTVKVWDIITGQCLQTLSGPNKHQSAVTCLQFNSRFVITSSDDGTVKLWDVKTGEFIRNLVALESGGSGGVVWRIRANDTKLICAVGSRNGTEETKLLVLDFDVEENLRNHPETWTSERESSSSSSASSL
ncbi:F-box/WD repeat-containing protein 7 isoform X1 [Aedes aegypti]|uniref:F-box domain-containing protein n=1 Tax=Aedes aegypti TaxID=7159 RepID=A0A6I8U460_AEDAE|nr:F-box/WD repeat-containing protein 7 isoform X1 [Aedes aegypti]XP_021699271.1 F-box/WD repeat-containing protein 7 isoform X1 [Aedes aegypti]XP_021699272.1 F-box/WD repeat-containing protein 7 isoform X1 [Aedes aegypti]XP_021699273.1 F-box/WD repeat-containing protein 7 isoform X1 [Aedes aegypti]XP_021699274.1 F-box/WD repeat-containing protein 7 isoform X1 [Aedes aegypti]